MPIWESFTQRICRALPLHQASGVLVDIDLNVDYITPAAYILWIRDVHVANIRVNAIQLELQDPGIQSVAYVLRAVFNNHISLMCLDCYGRSCSYLCPEGLDAHGLRNVSQEHFH